VTIKTNFWRSWSSSEMRNYCFQTSKMCWVQNLMRLIKYSLTFLDSMTTHQDKLIVTQISTTNSIKHNKNKESVILKKSHLVAIWQPSQLWCRFRIKWCHHQLTEVIWINLRPQIKWWLTKNRFHFPRLWHRDRWNQCTTINLEIGGGDTEYI
jgi:hypothetical protein